MALKTAKDFPPLKDGGVMKLNWKDQCFYASCCTCGLVHKFRFTVNGKWLQMRIWRREGLTKVMRKHICSEKDVVSVVDTNNKVLQHQQMKLSKTDAAYLAGFFDGEGSITIHDNAGPSPRGKCANHTLQVSIGNTDVRVLRWIKKEFGGALCFRKARKDKPKWRPVAQWTIRAVSALPFLIAIRPFLKMKHEQVDVAIKYQKTKAMRGPKLVTDAELTWRESQRQKIRALNARSMIG